MNFPTLVPLHSKTQVRPLTEIKPMVRISSRFPGTRTVLLQADGRLEEVFPEPSQDSEWLQLALMRSARVEDKPTLWERFRAAFYVPSNVAIRIEPSLSKT